MYAVAPVPYIKRTRFKPVKGADEQFKHSKTVVISTVT